MSEIYFVAARRGDGAPPGIEKAVDDRIFFTADDAHNYLLVTFGEDETWGVWKAIVDQIEEDRP